MPIEVELDATVFETTVNAPTLPAPIDVTAIGKLEQGKAREILETIIAKHRPELEAALAEMDVNRAHFAWCDMATDFLIAASGKTAPKDHKGAPKRGRPPVFQKRRLATEATGHCYGADSKVVGDWDIMANRCAQLSRMMGKIL